MKTLDIYFIMSWRQHNEIMITDAKCSCLKTT